MKGARSAVVAVLLATLAPAPSVAGPKPAAAPAVQPAVPTEAWGAPLFASVAGQSGFIQGSGGEGDGRLARDGDLATSWTWLGGSAPAWIDLELPGPATVAGLRVDIGQRVPGRAFASRSRPRELTVLADGSSVGRVTLADSAEPQYLALKPPVRATRLRIRVDGVHPGLDSAEAAFAEIEVYGDGRPRAGWDIAAGLFFHRDLGTPDAPAWYLGILTPEGSPQIVHPGSEARKSPRDPVALVFDRTGVSTLGHAVVERGDLWLLDTGGRRSRRVTTVEGERIVFGWSRDGEAFRVETWSPRRGSFSRAWYDRTGTELASLSLSDPADPAREFAARNLELDARFCPSPLIPPSAYPEGRAPSREGCGVVDAGARRDHPELRDAAADGDWFLSGSGEGALEVSVRGARLAVDRGGEEVDRVDGVDRAWVFPGDPGTLYLARRAPSGIRILARPFPHGGEERRVATLVAERPGYQVAAGSGLVVVQDGMPCAGDGSTRVYRADGTPLRSFAAGLELDVGDSEGGAYIGEVRLLRDQAVFSAWTRTHSAIYGVDPSADGGVRLLVAGGTFRAPPADCR